MKLLIITMGLMTALASAETLSVMKGQVGDLYTSQRPTRILRIGNNYYHNAKFPTTKGCYNAYMFNPRIEFGFLQFESTAPMIYPAETPWFSSGWTMESSSSAYFGVESKTTCEWNKELIDRDVDQKFFGVVTKTTKTLKLESLSDDVDSIQARLTIQGDPIANLTASGRNAISIVMKLKLLSCQLENGSRVSSFLPKEKSTDLRDVISSLRKRGYRSFERCDLSIGDEVVSGEIGKGGTFDTTSEGEFSILKNDRRIFLANRNTLVDTFFPVSEKSDPAAENRAIEAAKSFIEFIVDDYGDVLFNLSERRNVPDSEKNEVIRTFFEQNREKIQAWFKVIDENYSSVSLPNKISMLVSLKDMYQTISDIEKTISRSTVNLDRVIRSYQK